MKKRRRLRKGLAMLLSLAMVAGLVPAMSGGANTVQAASGTGTELSVSAYATKEQLMDGTFAPKEDGTAENYGKIVFGKNSSGEAQEWYILGKDSGVSEDNTIIFAASPIAKGQQFNSSASDKTYICEAGTGYWGDAVGVTVHANHYGASDLRVALRDMAADTSYFTTAEQGLMNATTVTTMDAWEDVPYTTTDKLYALAAADGYVPSYNPIKVGSSDSTVLAMSSYWSNVRPFWLRSPYDPFSTSVLEAVPSLFVNYIGVGNSLAVQPASNLNLSSVLFASSAKAASSDTVESGRIADGTAMTLRLDTSATDPATAVGTVIYDASGGVIAAQKNADATGTVSLVVQGKGTIGETEQDWYYSVPVGGTIVVTKEQIQQELSLSAAPNLAECKIWLETTIDNVAYASTAKAVGTIQVEKVNSVAVTDVKPPVGGEAFNTAASCNTKGIASITPAITYTTTGENGEKEVTGIADWNTTYKAAFTLTTGIVDDVAYVFGDSVSVTVDEESLSDALAPRVDGTVTVTREFTTAKRKIVSVAAPEVPTENTFTTYYGYERYTEVLSDGGNNELGKQAMVTLEGTDLVDSIPEPMDVTWTVANADGAPYDRTPGAKNTFRWIIPESEFLDYDASACQGYDAGTITGTVAITNKDYTPVTIIGENVTVTYHGEDTLDVSQYFNIDEHAGTPTYEVLENSTGTGTLEGATLTMTTLGTFVVKVSTPINDVYNKGERTLTITVNKAAPNVTALPTVADRIYHPSTVLADTDITDGTVTDVFGNSLAGTWSWKKADVVPTVDNDGYVAVFTPKDTVHYQSVEKTISVNVSKATPYIKKAPTATAITYGEALSASTLKDAVVCYSESDEEAVKGTFTWKEAATKPTVADSDKTEYDVVFTPTDAENYNTVETKITLTVNKAASAPGLPNSTMDVDYGKEKVSDITTLPEGWAWQDEDQDKALTVGTAVKATAVYTGADKGNYEVESVEISITRECTHATTEVKNEKDATCTEKGYTGDTCCTVCGKVITAGTDINALGHDFAAEFTVDKEATCMEEGSKSKHCSRCDAKSEVTEIPKHVDSNNDNICDSCGKYMDNIGARLAGHSLTLDGSVGVNFYMELSSEVISEGSAYMEFTLPGGKTSIVNVSDANTEVISGKTYYKFRCQVNAAEMTDTIKAQLKSTVGNSKVYEYTVKEYADYLFAHKEDNAEFAKAANLIEAMVNYGSYAQIYAGYNAENLAVGDAGNLKSVDDVTIGEYTYTPNANETNVQFAGANLSLLSTTTLRMYFRLSNVDVANVTFTYGGNTLEKTQSGDYYYVELVGIPASKLDDDCVVTVNDGTNSFDVTYTPMAYCANVVNRETTETRTESLKNLIKALVLYNRAADAYIPED